MPFESVAQEYAERALDMHRLLVGSSVSRRLITLPGESLLPLGIEEGAVLLVDTATTPRAGMAVVAMIGDEWRLLRYAVGKRGPYLVEWTDGLWHRVVDEHARVFGVVLYAIGRLTVDSDGWASEGFEPGVAYPATRRSPW